MFNGRTEYESIGYKKYQELDDEELTKRYDTLIGLWRKFLEQNDPTLIQGTDYYIHKKNMFEVIRRCDQRNVYYFVFHELEDICEYKDIALFCFWLITLKPFMVVNEDSNIYNCPNEMFALFLILTVIRGVYNDVYKNDKERKFTYPSKERIKDIVYDFKYCSISREAMISFVETFADTYGVGISYILQTTKEGK